MRRIKLPVTAIADPKRTALGGEFSGVASVASYLGADYNQDGRRVCINGVKEDEPDRMVILRLNAREAEKLARDILSFQGIS